MPSTATFAISRAGRKTLSAFFVLVFMAAAASCGNPATPSFARPPVPEQENENRPPEPVRRAFPSLHVGISSGDIHRTVWTGGIAVSLSGAREGSDFEGALAQVRGRGNSTWFSMGEKRPFRIRFNDPRPMFGSGFAARDWTLIANALDYTLMRNYSAYFLGRMLDGQSFAPSGNFVHLYLNGEYRGVYMVSDQLQVHEGRVELAGNEVPTLSEYFLEWCRRAENSGDVYFVIPALAGTSTRVPFIIDFPGGGILRQNLGHVEFAHSFVESADLAMWRGYRDEVSRIIDVDSFIDYYLVQELFRNHDVGWSSLRFGIRQTEDGPKLFAGPLWDFDFSSGSAYQRGFPYLPQGEWATRWNPWFRHLMRTDWFSQKVGERWERIKDNELAKMIERIWELAEAYGPCFERNFERWPGKLGGNVFTISGYQTSPSVMAIPDFAGNVVYLVAWLEQRISWMNWFFAQDASARAARTRSFGPSPDPEPTPGNAVSFSQLGQ